MKGFFKFIGILVIIGFVLEVVSEDKASSNKSQTTESQKVYNQLVNQPKTKSASTKLVQKQVTQTETTAINVPKKVATNEELKKDEQEDKRLFRYKQCEEIHSKDYCQCLLGHVGKKLGMFEEVIWLEGGALTSAEGIKALSEAEILCRDIDREYWAKKVEELKKEEEISKQKYEEKEKYLLDYKDDFCSIDSFRQLMDSHDKYKKDEVEFPIDDIKMMEVSGEKFCKVDFVCTWCGKDNITTQLFFKKTSTGKLEFDVNQGTDASNTLYFLAVWINNAETVRDLIKKGADVNYKYREDKDSFFTRTLGIGSTYFDIIKTCVEAGANIHDQYTIADNFSTTIYKETPLTKVVNMNDVKSAELFLQKGADPNISQVIIYDDGKKTETYPLERTVPFTDITMAKKLIEYGAKIPQYSYFDGEKMPLIWAVILGNPENLVERLSLWLSHGADANAEYRITKSMMVQGTDGKFKRINPEYKSKKPVEYAESNNMFDVVQLLQKYGAKPQYEITNLRWCDTDFVKQICGTLTNNSENTLKTVYLTFNLYDSDNAKIGEALAYTSSLDSKEKWKFKAAGDTENAKTYKLREITIYDF